MHTLKVTLKQHTPLVHFQHDQDGATLRASEVKPKLDRYILTKLGKQYYKEISDDDFNSVADIYEKRNPDKIFDDLSDSDYGITQQHYEVGKFVAKQKGWLVGKGEHPAMDYKMRIGNGQKYPAVKLETEPRTNQKGEKKYYSYWNNKGRKEDFPLLLSNMGGKDKEEDLINFSLYDYISVIIGFRDEELLQLIIGSIKDFFDRRNFGQRQDKGFGSFSVDSATLDGNVCSLPNSTMSGIRLLRFEQQHQQSINYYAIVFQTIDFYWKCLKSGVNFTQNGQYPDRYIKAYLWTYLDKKKLTWEKRKVKETFHLTTGNEKKENRNQASFARAILGCPDKFEYKNKGKTVTITHSTDTNSEDFIARIPSPIIFKPIIQDDIVNIYLIPDLQAIQQLKSAENVTFVFEVDKNKMNMNIDPNAIDIDELLRNYHQYIKDERFGKKAFENEDEYYEFIDKYELDENGQWFIPLDFKWRRLTDIPVRIFIKK